MEPSVAQELPIRYSLGCTLYRNENFGGKRFQISRQTRIPIYILYFRSPPGLRSMDVMVLI